MKEKNIIPKGYKPSVLGPIPNEWEVKRIKDIGKITSGTTPLRSELKYHNGNIPWVKTTDLNNDFITQTEESVTEVALDETSLKIYPKETVLVAMYGGFNQIGRTGILGIKATINQALSAITIDKKETNPLFLINWLNGKVGLWKTFAGSSRKDPNITSKDVGDFPIVYMSYKEQTAIATLLSTWDKAINTLTQLIAQKEQRKKWLMQQLLTGKKRLKGFKGEWKRESLSQHAKEVSIRNKENVDLTVLSCTKYDGLVPSLEYFGRKVFSDDLSTYKVVPRNHFAYATNHIEEGSIGYQSRFKEGLISPMYTVFKTGKEIHDDLLYLLLKSHVYLHEYKKRMEGSIDRRGGLRWEEFSNIKVPIPPMVEQHAIADFFSLYNREQELLTRRLNQIKAQKKGLMQILLTGKKRLVNVGK